MPVLHTGELGEGITRCGCRRLMREVWRPSLLLCQECLANPSQLSGLLLKTATGGAHAARQGPLAMTHLPDIATFLDERLRG
jgi:hypothetical protein